VQVLLGPLSASSAIGRIREFNWHVKRGARHESTNEQARTHRLQRHEPSLRDGSYKKHTDSDWRGKCLRMQIAGLRLMRLGHGLGFRIWRGTRYMSQWTRVSLMHATRHQDTSWP
jgi:hypothetical protein